MNLQSLPFILFCAQKLSLYQIEVIFPRGRFLSTTLFTSFTKNILTYVDFDCGNNFYPEAPSQVGQDNRERKNFSRSCAKPKCIPRNGQHNCSIDEEHNFNIFVNPYNFLEMDPAALKSLNRTNDRDSMSDQYPQTAAQQPRRILCSVFSSLRTMDCKNKGLRISFPLFQKAMDRIPPLVMNCSCI